MENLKTNISNCKDIKELERIINGLESDKQLSFKSDFARKLNDALWYDFKDFESCIKWCLNVCEAYDYYFLPENKN